MAAYDRKVCISNVYHLTKEAGKKMGDVETQAGVSPGYFSRLNKEDSTANPSVEVLASVADQLGVTLDALISRDYSAMSTSERYVMDFLDKLIVESNVGNSVWDRETKDYLYGLGWDQSGNAEHPLFDRVFNDDANEWEIAYQSLFNPGSSYYVIGDCFKLCIGGHGAFHLMKVNMDPNPAPPFDDDEFELYLVKYGRTETICRSWTYGNHVFDSALKTLYDAAAESSRHVKLSTDVRNAIDSFMAGMNKTEDNGDLPF